MIEQMTALTLTERVIATARDNLASSVVALAVTLGVVGLIQADHTASEDCISRAIADKPETNLCSSLGQVHDGLNGLAHLYGSLLTVGYWSPGDPLPGSQTMDPQKYQPFGGLLLAGQVQPK